nr:hypothetical protein [Abalone asfa-like virus]
MVVVLVIEGPAFTHKSEIIDDLVYQCKQQNLKYKQYSYPFDDVKTYPRLMELMKQPIYKRTEELGALLWENLEMHKWDVDDYLCDVILIERFIFSYLAYRFKTKLHSSIFSDRFLKNLVIGVSTTIPSTLRGNILMWVPFIDYPDVLKKLHKARPEDEFKTIQDELILTMNMIHRLCKIDTIAELHPAQDQTVFNVMDRNDSKLIIDYRGAAIDFKYDFR